MSPSSKLAERRANRKKAKLAEANLEDGKQDDEDVNEILHRKLYSEDNL